MTATTFWVVCVFLCCKVKTVHGHNVSGNCPMSLLADHFMKLILHIGTWFMQKRKPAIVFETGFREGEDACRLYMYRCH